MPASAAVVWQLGTVAPAAQAPRRALVEVGVVPSAVEAKEVA